MVFAWNGDDESSPPITESRLKSSSSKTVWVWHKDGHWLKCEATAVTSTCTNEIKVGKLTGHFLVSPCHGI